MIRSAVSPVRIVALILAVAIAGCNGDTGNPPTSSPETATPMPSRQLNATGQIFFIAPNGNLSSIDLTGTGSTALTESGGVSAFALAPGGSVVALEVVRDRTSSVRVVDAAGQQIFELEQAADPAWSPAGDRLVVARGSDLLVVDSTGKEMLEISDAARPVWSPSGESLALIRLDSDELAVPSIVEITTREETPLGDEIAPGDPTLPLVWHPGGESIAYRDAVYNLASGASIALPGQAVSFSPDGRVLLVTLKPDPTVSDTPARLLDMAQSAQPTIGLDIRPAPDDTPAWLFISEWIDWSPNGRYLIYLDPQESRPRARIYDTVDIKQSGFPDVRGERPRVSPDGKHVTFAFDGKVWVLALDGSALVDIAEGSSPDWQGR